MMKWFSSEEGEPGSGGPGSPQEALAAGGGEVAVAEMAERLVQTEQLVTQLKEMIREKDATLRTKDEQLKVEKETYESKLSKMRLQNKAKVTSLNTQLEDLKKQQEGQDTPTKSKKGTSEGGEQASRGKIVLLKKKVEELEQQLAHKRKELEHKDKEVEAQRQRGEDMDVMLTEKDRKLAEKEAFIVHLQTSLAGDQPVTPALQQKVTEDSGAMQELQLLVQSLTRRIGEAEERYSLLQEQTDSLKKLLDTEKEQYSQKESMYKQNIQTFKDIMLQKDNQLTEINQIHEQELFKLAAKSDASADLEQLLKALKQKLHEKEEVLLGKTQVIDVLQAEVDGRDQQIKDLTERLRRLQVERESLEAKMEAEKHVMRAQLRDLMEKQQAEVRRLSEQHQAQMAQTQQDLLGQLEELRRSSVVAPPAHQEASGTGNMPGDSASLQRITELEAQTKQKTEEASRSEAKFLQTKAWSKTRIRQLEEELKKSQAGGALPDLTALRSQVTALEEEREENLWKLEQYDELKAKNDMLEAKLVVYEEQQRTLQADLEQFTKRAASQASESGSADDTQSQVLEWQEMVSEAISARDRAKEEKAAMVLRMSHMEEEREALATRQQELEEELTQARGLGQHRAKKLAAPAERSLQEDFEFDGQAPFQDPRSTSESTTPMEGENMGGWWPEYSTPDTDGLRSVVEELELERNQLQEQILNLEERCQDLEDRLQLQSRIEALQNESEKLQSQLASVRSQQSRDAEKHQLLVGSLNEQLKGLSETQECLESSLIEKENTLAKTSEKLELVSSLRESLSEKEIQLKDVSDKLVQTEYKLENVSKKSSSSEKQCSELKTEVGDLTQKLSVLRDKTQKIEVTVETLQTELDQTNEELDKLNTAHLEERAQLIHDLQSCEREIDSLKDVLVDKDKEISALSGNMAEYAEQVTVLKQEIKLKEENLVRVEDALRKAEREAAIIKDSQSSDQHALNSNITELVGKLQDMEAELVKAKDDNKSKVAEVEQLIQQAAEDKKTIQEHRGDTQKQIVNHRNHLSECESHITSLKEQLTSSNQRLQESEGLILQLKDRQSNIEKQLNDKEQTHEKELKSFKDEQNKLVAQVEKYNNDVDSLSEQLQTKAQSEENIREEVKQKLETIATLENQLKATDKQAEDQRKNFVSELQVKDSENLKLSKEVQSKSESVSKLKNLLKSTRTEKQQLQEKLKGLTEELKLQEQNAKRLNEKVTSALELNSSLEKQLHGVTQENQRLELDLTERVNTISEFTAERDSLQAKLSTLETQHSQNSRLIQVLEKEKEELTSQTTELNRVLQQSSHSNSETLLEKTNECSHLNQLLREKEEQATRLQQQVQSFSSVVDQLKQDMEGKEQVAADLQTKVEAQRIQQTDLQETLSLLREQECTLKSGLVEKDAMLKQKQEEYHSLQNERINQENSASRLQAEVESLRAERSHLSQQLAAREETLQNVTQQCQNHKDELDDFNKTVKALSDQIKLNEEDARKLDSEAETRQRELTGRVQTITEENQQLQAACQSRQKELDQQLQVVSNLDGQLKATLEQNSSFSVQISRLTEDNQRLQEELAHSRTSVAELTTDTSLLQERNAGLQIQISDNQKIFGDVLKEKEELAAAVKDLQQTVKQSERSHSEGLHEKTSECANLSKALNEREERLQNLQEQVDGLKMQVSQLNMFLNEKEHVVSERSSQVEAQQIQLLQFQDTVSMLQEQGSVLKSGLVERDTLFQQKAEECSVYQSEILLQKDLVAKMQDEVEAVRRECLEAKQQIEQKDQILKEVSYDCQSHTEELSKRRESVVLLSSQLGVMNENLAGMEVELSDLKAAVQKLTAEKVHLMQEEDQRKAEIIDLKGGIQALNDQNASLKNDLQKTVAELSQAQEEVTCLNTSVCDRDVQLRTARLEKEQLDLTTQGKIDFLNQQENMIQQLNSRIAEQEDMLRKEADSVRQLRDQVEGLTSESSTLKSTLEKTQQSSLEHQNNSSAVVANLSSNLQAKEGECESLKEQISHLEESVAKINSSLQVQISESQNLKKSLEEKESDLSEQSKSLLDFQRRADEASLFKTQFMESTELVSQLQREIHSLSSGTENHKKSAEETQRAFDKLQDECAAHVEELQDVRQQLSQQTDEVSTLQRLLDDANREHQTANTTIETLRSELSSIQHRLEETHELNSSMSKEKDEAFASHQASVSLLTVELERLKSQHLHVVAQMNALTENLEQREMALHAINSQYTAQAKHTSQLLSEIQTLEVQNKRLNEEISVSKEEHQKHLTAVRNENTHLQEDVRRLLAEKQELERRHHQIWASQGQLEVQLQQQTSSMSELERMVSEKESLQAKVSARDEELSHLKENIQKIEQILQDSEKEWLLVLDREKHDKNLLAEELRSVENAMKSKDFKVNALKHDLDKLQGKLSEAFSAIRKGSDQLSAKELEASTSRIQLEKVLASVQEKDDENTNLQQALKAVEHRLHKFIVNRNDSSVLPSIKSEKSSASLHWRTADLEELIKQVEACHQSEVDALKSELRNTLDEGERSQSEKGQQLAALQERLEHVQSLLHDEEQKVKEASVKHASLLREFQSKRDQIDCMSIQISQQKELLSGLSQQLRDKDASIAQVMESASNERMKLCEENDSLKGQLENTERAHQTSVKQLEETSLQLEERASCSRSEIEVKNSEMRELQKGNADLKDQLARVSKEKDAMKKKLQAALLVRKDLLKKIEEYEKQSVNYKTEVSLLQDKLQEASNKAQATAETDKEEVSLLENKILEKEEEILDHRTEAGRLFEQAQAEKHILQATLKEKETSLSETLETLGERNALIKQLQTSVAERQDAFDQDRNSLIQKLEELRAATALDLENELTQMKQEKVMLQKKAQAALVARKDTMKKAQENEMKLTKELDELKDDYKALLEQHCQQTNQLNAVQLTFDGKVGELEDIRKTSLSYVDELDTLRQLVEQQDRTIQDLKISLAERESQCYSIAGLQIELEAVKSKCERISLEIASKDEALVAVEQRAEDLNSKLHTAEDDLYKAHAEVKEKMEEVEKYQERIQVAELRARQEQQALVDEKVSLEARLNISESAVERHICVIEEQQQMLAEENKALLEQVSTVQKTLAETQQQLSDKTEELDKAQLHRTDKERNLESLEQEKDDLRCEVTRLKKQLEQSENVTKEVSDDQRSSADVEEKLPQREDALVLSEKEQLIAALELQLQQQVKTYEMTVTKMKTETQELQRSQEDCKRNDKETQTRIALLTKKLQAALVSRKELLKENATVKEEIEKISARNEAREAEYLALNSSLLKSQQQNKDLESFVSSLNADKEKLSTELDRMHNDNGSLSAACDSLKQTIESITQQKQDFSCQLESLKDSQAEELTRWKSRHSELKQEYESLLQAYENVGSEMDKMRQLLEGAKRDRQEALRKLHRNESEMENLKRQVQEMEEENERIKEKMNTFSEEKQQKIEEPKEENQKIRRDLTEADGTPRTVRCDLTEHPHVEAVECLREQLEVQPENSQLDGKLEEASCTSEEKLLGCANNMQVKLDEALSLNNSLTAQIEAQKTELGAQLEINSLLQKEKQNLSERMEKIHNDYESQLRTEDEASKELKDIINRHGQETISLNERVRILEDDKSVLQEELENVQEISDKVKNENEYLETVILKNSERIDELTECVNALHTNNTQLSSQLAASKAMRNQVREEKEGEQLKLVREFEEKLKTVRRGNEGSKNFNKELQELLKEKHQEINYLQQNCIKYQEVILDLESSLKTSEYAVEHSEKELKKSSEDAIAAEERHKQVEAELSTCKNLLQEATEKIETVQSERDRLAVDLSQSEDQVREKTKSQQDEKQINSYVENQVLLQQQIDDLKAVKDRESQKVNELRQQIHAQDLQQNSLKRAFETNEVKLSALSSTPHGADATKRWNDLYQKTLHEKDNQLLEQGFVIKRFLEDMRVKDKEFSELLVTKSRLERTLNEYSVAAAAQQRQLFVMSASNAELAETAELTAVQLKELSAQVERLEQDRNTLNRQLADREDAFSQMQLNLQQTEKVKADADAQLLLLQSQNDTFQADLEKQAGISLQLKTLLKGKDAEISSLLSCRDGHVSGYLEQLQANFRTQAAVYEDRLTSLNYQRETADKELRGFETKVRSLQITVNRSVQEKEQMAAKIESFKNSMVSLQSERERLASEYRILQAKSQLEFKGKEGSPDGEGGATRGLKHEIRKLLHQMDDLNSENAMLRAQLMRYREDLNQVLSLKDNQLKVLLKKQQDVIKNLETQVAAAEKQHRESRLELQKEEEASDVLKAEISKLKTQVTKLEGDILTRKTTNEGKVIADLQQAVAAKAAECNDLQQKHLSQKSLADERKEKLQSMENEMDKKLTNAEDKFNFELDTFEREVEMMRSQREAGDQRVSELASELLEQEKQLSEAKAQNKDMGSQNESLCKAMVALQNDRDQLIENFKILRNRYDEELRETQAALNKVERSLQDATSDLAMFAKERDILVHKLKALESKDAHTALNQLVDELSKALTEKEKQWKQAALENTTYSRQLSAFSRSMASLQNDRDRLVDELAESRQGSSPATVSSMSVEKSKGSGTSAFQVEKHGPVINERQQTASHQTHKPPAGKPVSSDQEDTADTRSEREKEAQPVKSGTEESLRRLEAERIQLHRDLQRCMYEIQQRDQYFQQLNSKLQQAAEEKDGVAAQLRAVSQTLRDTQNHCSWLEGQVQGLAQGSVNGGVAPGAPQERSNDSLSAETAEASQLRERLLEVEQSLEYERTRRETAEEALRLAEDRAKSIGSSLPRDSQRDFSIEMETEEEWEALSLNPNQPLITRKVKGGMVACRRWLRGRSLYFSRLLTSRARSRYFFLAYLLTLHVLVLMCLSGAL